MATHLKRCVTESERREPTEEKARREVVIKARGIGLVENKIPNSCGQGALKRSIRDQTWRQGDAVERARDAGGGRRGRRLRRKNTE